MFQGTITNIQDIITCKGRLSFPKLKSLKLRNIYNHNYTAITQLHDDLFQSLIATSQLEELQFPTTFLDTSFNATIEDCIKKGSLVALKKCWLFYREENAEELIKHCPNITHLTGDWEEKENPSDYARGVLKITSIYGPKLKSFRCMVSRMEAVKAILEECTNLESLVLDYSSPELGNDRPIIESLPLFGYLEKLTELKLRFGYSDYYPIIEAEIVCELIKRCGMNLQSLKLQVNGYETHKILNAIGANCKNLKKLNLQIYDKMKDTQGGATKEKIRQLQESAVAILEGCQNLKTLYLDISGSDELGCNDIIYDQIGNKLPHLQHLTLADLMKYPTPSLVKLIHALPYCNIEMVMT